MIDNKTSDYICYLDPNDGSSVYVAFVLNGPKGISEKYLNDFQEAIKSFLWITDRVQVPQGMKTAG